VSRRPEGLRLTGWQSPAAAQVGQAIQKAASLFQRILGLRWQAKGRVETVQPVLVARRALGQASLFFLTCGHATSSPSAKIRRSLGQSLASLFH
jgi:hypothetical protein